jgi:hypothetical protein
MGVSSSSKLEQGYNCGMTRMEIINEGTSTFPTLMCHELTDEPVDMRTGIHIICHPEFSSMADIFLFSPF